MELRHLRYFVAVADRLHFGRAAADLRIAQPSLSQQIRRLERELGAELLERTKRRVRLTEAGRLFLPQAREILARADRAAALARGTKLATGGRLHVSIACWVDPGLVIEAIRRLHDENAVISVDLRSLPVRHQLSSLREERIDVSLVRSPVEEPPLESQTLTAEPFIVALPSSHRLTSLRRVPMPALADEPHIMPPRGAMPVLYDLALKACRDGGFIPSVRGEADRPEAALGFVAAGIGVAIVPAWMRRLRVPGVVSRPLTPSPRTLQTVAAWRRNAKSPLVSDFLRILREVVGGDQGEDRRKSRAVPPGKRKARERVPGLRK
jgi:DNA-binding transcriptional LysR family regulator